MVKYFIQNFIQIVKGKTSSTKIQFIRYVFVGGTAFLFDFFILFILTEELKYHYLVSAAISFIIATVINYLLSIFWVFNSRNVNNKNIEFIVFAVIGVFGLLFNELIMWFFSGVLGIYYIQSKLIAVGVIFFWNFFLRKYVLFN